MKQSIGYTLTLNIVIIFIIVVFAVLAMSLSYYKTFKVSNVITHAIEKYEGYNSLAEAEILMKISSLGYNITDIECKEEIVERTGSSCLALKNLPASEFDRSQVDETFEGQKGYCIYKCPTVDGYYYYKISTNMLLNLPMLNNILKLPVYNNTANIYDFENKL